jgi:mutator protein MutT
MSGHETNIVVCGLIHRDGKIFVARRAKTKAAFPDKFELPGGHVEPGENLKAALMRELSEELGIKVEIGQAVDAFTFSSGGIFKCEVFFLCQITDKSQEPVLNPSDHSEGRWLAENETDVFNQESEEKEALKHGFDLLKKGMK